MGHAERILSVGLLATAALAAPNASAFCRTTTCDAANPTADCKRDANLCSTTGIPLFWGSPCIGFGVQKDGSPKRHISYATFDRIVGTAFNQWTATACTGGHPNLRIWDVGPIDCGEPQFNQHSPNANVWMFRDGDWPYTGAAATLALTTVSFALKTGQILDADVEVNSYLNNLTTSDVAPGADLQSIVTHEAGHFLGLAHSSVADATMFASYSAGDLSFRTLSDDDHQGICTAYPPNPAGITCTSPAEPRNGFTKVCITDDAASASSNLSGSTKTNGCSFSHASASSDGAGLGGLVVALGLGVRRLRRVRRR